MTELQEREAAAELAASPIPNGGGAKPAYCKRAWAIPARRHCAAAALVPGDVFAFLLGSRRGAG